MSPRLSYSGKCIGIYGSISIRLTEHLSLYSVNNSSVSNNLHRFKGNSVNELGGESALHFAQDEMGNPGLRGICRQGALPAQTSQDRQQQVDTHHWSSWCPPSQAHTDRCLEQCSDRGHIYLHSGLSEREINQMRNVGTRKTPQQHSCFPSRSQVSLKNNMHA